MAADAVYVYADGLSVDIRVIRRAVDPELRAFDTRIAATGTMLDLRASEVEQPQRGDTLWVGSERFEVQGEPVIDTERLIWTLDTRPIA